MVASLTPKRWNLKIEDPKSVERSAGDSIYQELKRISAERDNVKRVQRLNRLFPILEKFELEPNLYRCQNLYFEISTETREQKTDEANNDWMEQFSILGDNLGVKVG